MLVDFFPTCFFGLSIRAIFVSLAELIREVNVATDRPRMRPEMNRLVKTVVDSQPPSASYLCFTGEVFAAGTGNAVSAGGSGTSNFLTESGI